MMASAFSFLISGVVLGLSGGLLPGPLLTLVLAETLKHGIREGVKISFAPLVSDAPIVCVTIFVMSRLSDVKPLMGTISLLGGVFLLYLGYESLSAKAIEIGPETAGPRSLRKGVIANFLNPAPYMFWLSIGSPMVLRAYDANALSAWAFVLSFYVFLVGSKILLAVVVGKSRRFLKSGHYIYTIRFLGIVLLLFAALFIRDSLGYFGMI